MGFRFLEESPTTAHDDVQFRFGCKLYKAHALADKANVACDLLEGMAALLRYVERASLLHVPRFFFWIVELDASSFRMDIEV